MSHTRMHRAFRIGAFAFFVAAASDAADSDIARARALYDSGVRAARHEDWATAEREFACAHALYPSPLVLGSLAGAQAKRGHVLQSLETYRRVLASPGDLSAREVAAFEQARARTEARVAHVRIVVADGARPTDRVEVDAEPVPEDVVIPLDPGAHSVRLVRAERSTRLAITLADGESRDVSVVAPAAPLVVPEPPTAERREASGGLLRSPWFWTGVGVVVAGAAVATVCLAGACKSDDAYAGTMGRVSVR